MGAGPAVVVIGSVNVDAVVRVPRLPRPGETVTDGVYADMLGGKGANQAAAAARLGAATWLVARVGDDDAGERARADLAAYGVDITRVSTGGKPTGVALVIVGAGGDNLIAVAPGANRELTGDEVAAALSSLHLPQAVVLCSLEVPDDAVVAAAVVAHQRGYRFVLNPAPARPVSAEVLARCAVVTPNEHELDALGSVPDLLGAGVGAVVVTRGAAGIDVWAQGREAMHHDAFPVDVVDTTGAGDACSGALAWALARGDDLDRAVEAAAVAGALACRAVGARASLADRAELEAVLGS